MSFLVTIKNETTDIGDAKFTAKQVICELPHGNTVEILETDEDVAIIMHYHTPRICASRASSKRCRLELVVPLWPPSLADAHRGDACCRSGLCRHV
jgi:hypothetical protein